MFLYIDHNHMEYLLYYILIVKQSMKTKQKLLISVSWHTNETNSKTFQVI
jgi:hypothetical protein